MLLQLSRLLMSFVKAICLGFLQRKLPGQVGGRSLEGVILRKLQLVFRDLGEEGVNFRLTSGSLVTLLAEIGELLLGLSLLVFGMDELGLGFLPGLSLSQMGADRFQLLLQSRYLGR